MVALDEHLPFLVLVTHHTLHMNSFQWVSLFEVSPAISNSLPLQKVKGIWHDHKSKEYFVWCGFHRQHVTESSIENDEATTTLDPSPDLA